MKHSCLADFAKKLGIAIEDNRIIEGFAFDSREIKPNEVFFALKGEKVDGHSYLKDVASKGALAAVVSKEYKGESFGLFLLPVDNVVDSLQMLAKEVQSKRSARIIAVTGSVGKTTTKEFIAKLLEKKFRVGKSPGNANSQVSIPLTILNSKGDEEILVLEMGMTLPGEITKLIKIAPPEIAVITRIGIAHTEFFPEGTKEIARAKAEILSHPKTTLAFINTQCIHHEAIMRASCKKIPYAVQAEVIGGYELSIEQGKFQILANGEKSPFFSLPFNASHLVENFLAAASIAKELGMSWDEIVSQAQLLAPYKRRFERVERDGVVFINDSYNANPESTRAALLNLPSPAKGKKRIAVLGDMRELGKFSEEGHREIGKLAMGVVEKLLCFGRECMPMMQSFEEKGKKAEHFSTLQALKDRLFSMAEPGDVVLIKGSNSLQLWRILEESNEH